MANLPFHYDSYGDPPPILPTWSFMQKQRALSEQRRLEEERERRRAARRPRPKLGVGRNQKCPCNSGKKFKHCCLKPK